MKIARSLMPTRYWIEKKIYKRTSYSDKLSELKERYRNKPMIIIGNGPSLNSTPLDRFVDIPSIGMNKINLLFPRVKWRPSFIVCLNRHVMRQNQEYFATTDIPTYLCWQSRWFMAAKYRDKVDYFLNRSTIDFSKDITFGVGIGGTVTYTALQFAYYMGANPVILFGIDHSFSDKGAANKLITSQQDDANHFDKNYFGKGAKWNLPDLEESERAYLLAKQAFESDTRVIYDATIDGKLTIFPKIDISKALGMCGL